MSFEITEYYRTVDEEVKTLRWVIFALVMQMGGQANITTNELDNNGLMFMYKHEATGDLAIRIDQEPHITDEPGGIEINPPQPKGEPNEARTSGQFCETWGDTYSCGKYPGCRCPWVVGPS